MDHIGEGTYFFPLPLEGEVRVRVKSLTPGGTGVSPVLLAVILSPFIVILSGAKNPDSSLRWRSVQNDIC
jgi:hypothetical protein